MIVWGGSDAIGILRSGGRYDPASNTWASTNALTAPLGRVEHTAVWTGTEMIVWGGHIGNVYYADGGRYNPVSNTWAAVSGSSGLEPRAWHTAVWTGDELVVWGGRNSQPLDDGARYNPQTNQWAPVAAAGAPSDRYDHTAVWDGQNVLVWGGDDFSSGPDDSVYRYFLAGDSWTTFPLPGAPPVRAGHSAFWTGSEMIVWGGIPLSSVGGRYAFGFGWTRFSTGTQVPNLTRPHPTVWTGSEMLAWGRLFGEPDHGGWRYDPALTIASEIDSAGPSVYAGHSGVWTGDEMVVWGGRIPDTCDPLASGARYDPLLDAWSSVSTVGAPEGRWLHRAIWTGGRMILWGGRTYTCGDDFFDEFITTTGGSYDPASDSWSALPLPGLSKRQGTGVVWTGSEMIVWGGVQHTAVHDDGARYDPGTNSWTPMSTVGAPQANVGGVAAVWTGEEMVAWTSSGVGGRYDPVLDEWNPVSGIGAPDSSMRCNTVVWTGTEMVLWGEDHTETTFGLGTIYRPSTDTWIPVPADNAPDPTCYVHPDYWEPIHNSVWTGEAMITEGPPGHPYPTFAALNTNSDVDDDDVPDIHDCAPLNPDVWATPGPARDLLFPSATLITWATPLEPGGSVVFSLLRSSQADDFSAADCAVDGTTDTQAAPFGDPASGTVDSYLVRVQNACGSNAGYDSDGGARSTPACP
jgi:N-acetylneuraminic acid mutarotase